MPLLYSLPMFSLATKPSRVLHCFITYFIGKSVETQCWNQLPTTPFAYYHFMRRNNANSCGVMRIMPSASPAPSPLPHDPVPLHHSLQSDLTIEGNCNSNINNNNNNNNSNGCTADLQHDAKGKDGALPSLSPGLSKKMFVFSHINPMGQLHLNVLSL